MSVAIPELNLKTRKNIGPGPTARINHSFNQPIDKTVNFVLEIPEEERGWSSCMHDRSISIYFAMRVTNKDKRNFPNSYGYVDLFSHWGISSSLAFELTWRQCS